MRPPIPLGLTGAVAVFILLTASQGLAQNEQSPDQGSGTQGGRRPRQTNFDPAEYRQRSLDRYRERLEVVDDAEWKALKPLIEKILDTRTAFRAAGRGISSRAAQSGTGGDPSTAASAANSVKANPAAESLQKALDAQAPSAEIKASLRKFLAYRKAKQAEMERAQEAFRAVLTSRQEALAVLSGLL